MGGGEEGTLLAAEGGQKMHNCGKKGQELSPFAPKIWNLLQPKIWSVRFCLKNYVCTDLIFHSFSFHFTKKDNWRQIDLVESIAQNFSIFRHYDRFRVWAFPCLNFLTGQKWWLEKKVRTPTCQTSYKCERPNCDFLFLSLDLEIVTPPPNPLEAGPFFF